MIACFAGPSFHEVSAPLEVVVCADAGAVNSGTDKAGSNANAEIRVRRSMEEHGVSPVMFSSPMVVQRRYSWCTGSTVAAEPLPVQIDRLRAYLMQALAWGYAKSAGSSNVP